MIQNLMIFISQTIYFFPLKKVCINNIDDICVRIDWLGMSFRIGNRFSIFSIGLRWFLWIS